MILREEERNVEEEAQRSGDDWGLEAVGSGLGGTLAQIMDNRGGRADKPGSITRLTFARCPLQWNPDSPVGVFYPGDFLNS
jgi:hypothetical protein